LLETIVSSNGFVVPETAGFRMIQLLDSEHAHFLGTTTRQALQQSRETWDFQAGIGGPDSAGVGAAARIAPVGLAHALGRLNTELLVREVLRSSLLTHAHPEAVNGALAIAYALNLIVRDGLPANMLPAEVASFIDEDAVARQVRLAESLLRQRSGPRDDMDALARIGTSGYVAEAVAAAMYLVGAYGADVEGALITAVNAGGATDATGAMTGALCGAIVGARALPERLVEGLESRMYILMAAPALYRTAQRRAGLFLQLHQRP
jgi:ADP-ribosylglycohydrolase